MTDNGVYTISISGGEKYGKESVFSDYIFDDFSIIGWNSTSDKWDSCERYEWSQLWNHRFSNLDRHMDFL